MKKTVGRLVVLLGLISILASCNKPAKLEIHPENVVLEGVGSQQKLQVKVFDEKGNPITEGFNVVWFSADTKHIKLNQAGEITALSSGEAEVEAELVDGNIKAKAHVRIKVPSSIKVSHERLRLWVGQVKDDVYAEVLSDKGAFIEGYLPTWSSDDPTIVKVEPIVDSKRRQSWVKMTGLKTGITYINASFRGITKSIRVGVFGEDDEVDLSGQLIEKPKNSKKKKK